MSSASVRRGSDPPPVRAQLTPRRPVRRRSGLQRLSGRLHVAVQQGPVTVGQRVAEDGRCAPPGQAVLFEAEFPDHRRHRRHRIEAAEGVVDEAVGHVGVALDGSADRGLGLQQEHVPAGVGEQIGRHQAVGSGPDHHGLACLRHQVDRTRQYVGQGGLHTFLDHVEPVGVAAQDGLGALDQLVPGGMRRDRRNGRIGLEHDHARTFGGERLVPRRSDLARLLDRDADQSRGWRRSPRSRSRAAAVMAGTAASRPSPAAPR